ncbi:hypothetical protein DAPPUDRAFT_259545 [Daphnia pulex]|uniref:Uncharacterized protein n=1 Tax=Daphnia pulex TaxID=6669 RepID=E9HHE2_DAPPU|nr:hypothetical protein DAPPUDRAFT_259545 [Daphnia pulex]|eukprot:EFX68847.1 hypothetical protein DAPPUDRAFT_259545 [Daphnia pulex]
MTTVKFIFKYVYKGHDCSNIESKTGTHQQAGEENEQVFVWNEIPTFTDTRYVSAPDPPIESSSFLSAIVLIPSPD